MKTIGEKIKFARKYREFTQVELAKASNITQQQISAIESDRSANQATVVKLAKFLNISLDWIYFDIGAMELGSSIKDISVEEQKLIEKFKSFSQLQKDKIHSIIDKLDKNNQESIQSLN